MVLHDDLPRAEAGARAEGGEGGGGNGVGSGIGKEAGVNGVREPRVSTI